jgi:putative glutamine amidotransferase
MRASVIRHSAFLEVTVSLPLIGITGYKSQAFDPPHRPTFALGRQYVGAVQAAGGLPVVIPPTLDEDELHELFARLDGLLLPGGGDIDPANFHEPMHPATKEISADRDHAELALARWALAKDKPVLAICRGIQVMNVSAGGTLVQDIPSQIPNALPHRYSGDTPRDFIAHTVRVDAGTRLASILGTTEIATNSWHHQSCKEPGRGIVYTAWSPDGVVEAAEMLGHRFAVAVQWHPEEMFHNRADMLALFRALVEAA